LEVVFVGSGGHIVTLERSCPCLLVDGELLFDCGFGSLKNYRKLNLPLEKITRIFLTHHHADHVGDLVAFLWAMAMEGRKFPLKIFGPNETSKLVLSLLKLMNTPEEYTMLKMNFKELKGGESLGEIKTLRTPHKPVNLAYRLEKSGKSLCYSGDTPYHKPLAAFASKCNLLIHDSVFLNEQKELAALTNHSTAGEAGRVARLAEVEKLVLFHVLPFNIRFEREILKQAAEEFDGEIIMVRDLDKLRL
jgi:ribonuclease Z